MKLIDLIFMTRMYCRDNNNYVFTNSQIRLFLNQAIDRIKQYKVFNGMSHLENDEDTVKLLPEPYHYMLALFAASRCYDMDERFYEGVEKRNEFEGLLEELISEIQSGNLEIIDSDGNVVEDGTTYIDYVKDEYYNLDKSDGEVIGC